MIGFDHSVRSSRRRTLLMPLDHRLLYRGTMRSWLKFILETGVLELLEPAEASAGEEPALFAGRLLAQLRLDNGGIRADDPLATEFHGFRRRVEDERRLRRLVLLGREARPRTTWTMEAPPQTSVGAVQRARPQGLPRTTSRRAAIIRVLGRMRWLLAPRERPRPVSRVHPLWDRYLDG
jgi:hypothetical protein